MCAPGTRAGRSLRGYNENISVWQASQTVVKLMSRQYLNLLPLARIGTVVRRHAVVRQPGRGVRSAHEAVAGPSCRRRPGWPASTRSDRCLRACSVRSGGSTADAGRTSQTGSWPAGLARKRGVTWNGAGGCVIFSHYRNQPLQVEISPTKYDTFKKAGKIPSTTTRV